MAKKINKIEIKTIVKNTIPDPNGKPKELTKNLSKKLARDGNPGIMPSTIIPIIIKDVTNERKTPNNDIVLDFLK